MSESTITFSSDYVVRVCRKTPKKYSGSGFIFIHAANGGRNRWHDTALEDQAKQIKRTRETKTDVHTHIYNLPRHMPNAEEKPTHNEGLSNACRKRTRQVARASTDSLCLRSVARHLQGCNAQPMREAVRTGPSCMSAERKVNNDPSVIK